MPNIVSKACHLSSIIAALLRRRLRGMALLFCCVLAAGPVMTQVNTSPANQPPGRLTIVEFSDFECPFSAQAVPGLKALLRDYPGKIQLVVKNLPLASHPHARLAHAAALAAKRQGKFWEMSDLLFVHQNLLERQDLIGYARELHLNVRRFKADLDRPDIRDAITEDVAEARALAVDQTPTFFIAGQKLIGADWVPKFKSAVERILIGAAGPGSQPESASAQDPGKGSLPITTEGSPTKGPKDAPVTIVEFSDLQCPYCALETSVLRDLLAEYPGQIQLIFKHFPLDIHPQSQMAHRAALAAARQGKFWEMHDLLFANQKNLNRDAVLRAALQLGLDLARFEKDQEDPQSQAIIDRDLKEGTRLGVSGTPSFFINGKLLAGAQPRQAFEGVLNANFHLVAVAPQVPDAKQADAGSPAQRSLARGTLTLIWFSDLESPLTPRAYELVREAQKSYPGTLQVTMKHSPITFHGEGLLAHEALLAAGAQGKFWPMHDVILASQRALGREDLLRYASQIGLNLRKFQAALDEKTYETAVKADLEEARVRNVRGTPAFFINDTRVDGLIPFERLHDILEREFNRVQAAADQRAGGSGAQ